MPTTTAERDRAVREAAALRLAPGRQTRQMWARLAALVDGHGLSKAELDAAPVRLVAMSEVRDTDWLVVVEVDGKVVRHRVQSVAPAKGRVRVKFGSGGAIDAPETDSLLVERA